ncbi:MULTISPECIES: cell division protein CrgA [unclassified Corynebacterium]|uniref:cell division protein CrgA n=1 Tax=unclassified Corynebacterium TaxID=2624378 RepID=UPI0026498B9D|nr:cell division protein CrgA [Corynebacterium sp.]MDN6332844.1 cell division protein CrgA [Micrococcaceae bacterium]MDN5581560.1 cell division protein CrgA [Corynebacterium sp.]MDN5721283.1 cell division protein CrgA [Corynebacterium sp.]MDN6258843.1 cell division protein CrgA [Corynebacterium sp.]MDN6325321.1 cell division protein CrgA [Corynebacterium sp.]
MPKSRISDSPEYNGAVGSSAADRRTPVKLNATGTPRWYIVVMLGLMLLGLAWLVVNYIAGPHIPFMAELNAWNYLIGFGLFIVGLLMTMGWK